MIMTTFKEFLEHGRLGPIVPGVTTKDELRSWLGKGGNLDYDELPRELRSRRRPKFEHWKYGPLEFAFYYKTLVSIGFRINYPPGGYEVDLPDEPPDELSEGPPDKLPDALHMEGYFPTTDTDLEEFVAYLDREGIPHPVDPNWTWAGDIVTLAVGSAEVWVSFHVETNKVGKIGTATVFPPE
jgi:hypothetical protein